MFSGSKSYPMLKKTEKHSETCMFAKNVWTTNFNWTSTPKYRWWNCSQAKTLVESWDSDNVWF